MMMKIERERVCLMSGGGSLSRAKGEVNHACDEAGSERVQATLQRARSSETYAHHSKHQ
jgi:hypothetical protein